MATPHWRTSGQIRTGARYGHATERTIYGSYGARVGSDEKIGALSIRP
jgi:hypothetical protein